MGMGKLVKFVGKRRGRARKARPVATKALRKVIQKEIHKDVERKFFDNQISATGGFTPYLLDSTAEVVTSEIGGGGAAYGMLPFIIPGNTQNTRVGEEIRVKRLSFNFRATAFTTTATGVLFIVRYPQCDGRAPTLNQIWSQVTDIATAERNVDYMNDYHILGKINISADKGISLNRLYSWSKTYKGAGLKVEYDATAADVTSVEFNNIFLIAQANGSDDVISIGNPIFRVSYTDM